MKKVFFYFAILLTSLQTFAQNTSYTYDNNNRLIKVEYDNGITISYTYDALGNRLSKVVTRANEAATITAINYTRKYGDENPRFDYTVEGAAINGEPEIICEATATSPVGTYPIVIQKGSVTNTNCTYVNGTLTIEKAVLEAQAEDATRTEGEDNPPFIINYKGFKNNETEEVLLEHVVASSPADRVSAPGTYPIVASGGYASNYMFKYVDGTLTIVSSTSVDSVNNDEEGINAYFGKPLEIYSLSGICVFAGTLTDDVWRRLPLGVYIVKGKRVMKIK